MTTKMAGVRIFVASAFAMLSAIACGEKQTLEPEPEDLNGARQAASVLGGRLRERLIAAMQEGGPSQAVSVCAEEAPEIARTASEETGYDVGRTSLRIRNTDNAPDDWEREQLLMFIEQIEAGADPEDLEVAAITRTKDAATFRWAKPIMMEAPCLTCHGADVDPGLLTEIRKAYPDDAATGFSIGDVRGIFTVSKTLPKE